MERYTSVCFEDLQSDAIGFQKLGLSISMMINERLSFHFHSHVCVWYLEPEPAKREDISKYYKMTQFFGSPHGPLVFSPSSADEAAAGVGVVFFSSCFFAVLAVAPSPLAATGCFPSLLPCSQLEPDRNLATWV